MLCSLFESLMIDPDTFDETLDKNRMRTLICQSFVFCCIWCLGGNVMEKDRDTIDIFIRDQFEEDPDAQLVLQMKACHSTDLRAFFATPSFEFQVYKNEF